MLDGLDRIKRFSTVEGDWAGPLVVVIGFFIIALALMMGPPMETTTQYSNEQTFSTEQGVYVEVGSGSNLYEEGDIVEDNTLYLFSWNDSATITVESSVPENTELTKTSYIRYVVTDVEEEEVVYTETSMVHESSSSEEYTDEFNIDVSELIEKRNSIQSNFGTSARTSVEIVTETSYDHGVYEGSYSVTSEFSQASESAYRIPVSENSVTERESEEVTQVDDSMTIAGTYIGEFKFLLTFIGLTQVFVGILLFLGHRYIDVEYIHGKVLENRYNKYIVRVEESDFSQDKATKTEELEELLNHAINSGKSVIKDHKSHNYYVNADGTVYYYPAYYEINKDISQETSDSEEE